jgi:hypothetical protein
MTVYVKVDWKRKSRTVKAIPMYQQRVETRHLLASRFDISITVPRHVTASTNRWIR